MRDVKDDTVEIDFFMNGLCSLCHIAKNELMGFEAFHKTTEDNWRKINIDLEAQIEKILKEHPKEHHNDIIDDFSLDLHENQEKYPSIHRSSLLITLYCFFENTLNDLCYTLSDSVGSNIKLTDLQGSGVERALLYLSKVAKFDLSKMGGTLPFIKGINKVRNTIVHNGGSLPPDPDSAINIFVKNTSSISGSPNSSIRLEHSFINEMIEIFIQFLEDLDVEVQAHIQMHMKSGSGK